MWCPTCHLVKTHDHLFTSTIAFGKVIGFGRMRKTNHEVYKGICLRCSTLMEAKLRLGEPFNGGDWMSIDMQRQMSGNTETRNTGNANENEDLISQDFDIPLRSTEVSGITMDADLIAAAVSQFDLASEIGEDAGGASLEGIQEEHEIMSDDDSSQHSPLDRDTTHEIGCNPNDPADYIVMPSSSEESTLLSSVFKCASCDEVLDILKENTSTSSASSVLFSLQRFDELLLHQQSLLNKGWPKVLAMVASSHMSNAQVQAQVFSTIRAIISVKQHQKRYISDFVLYFDVKKDVIEVMETHDDNESLQENACGLIAAIADVEKQALSLLRVSNGKLVHLLMRALRCPSDEGKVQENALKALLRLSSASLSSDTPLAFLEVIYNGNNASNTKLSLGQAINNIIHSMQHMDNTSLQIHGARLLSNILESNSALRENWSSNMTDEILHHVLKFKASDDVKLHEAFLCLLAKLSFFEGNKFGGHEITLLSNAGLIDSVVGCMYQFPQSPSIQGAAASILSNVAINDELRMDFSHRGGTSRIIDALHRLRHDSILVCKAFSALSNLLNGADVDILHSPDANASESIALAMKTHPHNLSVQLGGTNALWALSARDKSFKDSIVAIRRADTVAAAMAEFIGSKQLQEKCVLTLWSLASATDHQDVGKNTRNQVVGQAAIKPLVNGLSAHMDSEKVCMDGLCCMKCLSTDPDNKKLLEENCAVELIFSCLWLHSSSSTVCKEGLAALANISVNATTNEVSKITSAGLDAVVLTMRTHQTVKAVQESAIIYLRNSTFRSDNITTLGQNPYIRSLVQSARSYFDSAFQARADDVLTAMQ